MASDGFAEYMPQELARLLHIAGEGLDSVELVVRNRAGDELVSGVMRLRLEHGSDVDRSGGYRWVRIVGQLET